MDTSKEFILMCARAVEIQKKSPEELITFMANERDKIIISALGNYFVRPRNTFVSAPYYTSTVVWLPTQGQLQDLVKHIQHISVLNGFDGTWFGRFSIFVREYTENYAGQGLKYHVWLDSMEKFLLAFVMQELYSKQWDGEKWITNGA